MTAHVCSAVLCRYEHLEEQLNDLTELHQNEMTNLKQELASMEEKVAYQSYERARDIQVRVCRLCGGVNGDVRTQHYALPGAQLS